MHFYVNRNILRPRFFMENEYSDQYNFDDLLYIFLYVINEIFYSVIKFLRC